jgi:hypothetical protein
MMMMMMMILRRNGEYWIWETQSSCVAVETANPRGKQQHSSKQQGLGQERVGGRGFVAG